MTELSTTDALTAAKEHAQTAWYRFTRERNLRVIVPDWRISSTPDGSPQLAVEVVGPGAAHALRLFTSDCHVALRHPGDQCPGFDYSTPGRVACVMRLYGVWIELWHPDLPAPTESAPRPVTIPSRTSWRRSRPGGRLPFTRRQKESPAT